MLAANGRFDILRLLSIEFTPNSQTIRLYLSESLTDRPLILADGSQASADIPPLAKKLLNIEGILSVLLIDNSILLTCKSNWNWKLIFQQLGCLITLSDQATQDLKILIGDSHGSLHPTPNPNQPIQAPTQPEPLQILTQAEWLAQLTSPIWETRLQALRHLEITSQTYPAIVSALQDKQLTVRHQAAIRLGAAGLSEAVEPLIQTLLEDSSSLVRTAAADALILMSHPRATDAMLIALEDPSRLVRWRAAKFLEQVATTEAIPYLSQACQKEPDQEVTQQMEAALIRLQAVESDKIPLWMQTPSEPLATV